MPPGTEADPLRVAIVGSGPAAFYTAQHLLAHDALTVSVDMFERLPTPFGLVRLGVAPDHQKIKSVTRVYEKTASHPRYRFFGNVDIGTHLIVEDLRRHYHQIVFCTGAQTDRRLGIPGEDLDGSHTATAFVAWYNGHPDYRDLSFDLTREHVVVVGVGNVAVDVARILCRTHEELARTDIADHALAALRESRVRTVTMLGRRGPAQAAFTNAEIQELGEMPGATTITLPDEVALDPVSRRALEARPDKLTRRKLEILEGLAGREGQGGPRRLVIRFLVSPVALEGDDRGRVSAVKIVRNELYATDAGAIRSRPTEATETLPAGLVFRSVGYRGVPVRDVPFRDDWAVIPNEGGRVTDDGVPVPGLYAAGWIKRGPQGVIGTNKPDALETVRAMAEDAAAGRILSPPEPSPAAAEASVRRARPRVVTYEDWRKLDALEIERGSASGRPRVKLSSVDDMLAALDR